MEAGVDAPGRSSTRACLAGIGLAQGLVLWLMTDVWEDSASLELRSAAIGFALAAGLTAQFTWTGALRVRWAGVALAFGFVIGATTWWVFAEQAGPSGGDGGDGGDRGGTWVMAAFVALYVAVPFAQIQQRSGRLRFPYSELFHHSWNNFFVGLIASLFSSATGTLLYLWGALFALVGIDVFKDVFQSDWFVSIVYAGVFGFGLAVGLESERVTDALRRILFAICQVLLPIVAFVAVLFLLVLPFTGIAPLWETGRATPILLGIVALLVLFENAVYQDGREAPPYSRGIDTVVRAALAITPAYTGLAAWSTWVRVDQYGLTPTRVWAAVLVFIASCYAIGYAFAIVSRRTRWLDTAGLVNVMVAPVIVVLALALHGPLLDPLRLSAEQQVRRLLRGDVSIDDFDYGLLRFELGSPGDRALGKLENNSELPNAETMHAHIRAVRASDNRWEWMKVEHGAEYITAVPPLVLSDGLRDAFAKANDVHLSCDEDSRCVAFEAPVGARDETVVCVAGSHVWRLECFAEHSSAWTHVGGLQPHTGGRPLSQDELVERVRADAQRAIAARYRDLEIGDAVFRFYPK